LPEPRRHVLDGLVVLDLDAGLLGEPLEFRFLGVHVQRPVGEADLAVALLVRPEVRRGGAALALAHDTAAGECQSGGGESGEPEGVAAAVAGLSEAAEFCRGDGSVLTHDDVPRLGYGGWERYGEKEDRPTAQPGST